MPMLRLENYPNICRICLQHRPNSLLTTLDTLKCKHVQLIDGINELLLSNAQELETDTPAGVCEACYTELISFLTYRNRVKFIGKFLHGVAKLRNSGQTEPLEKLFREHQSELLAVLQELNITDKGELIVQDLVDGMGNAQDKVQKQEKHDEEYEKLLAIPCTIKQGAIDEAKPELGEFELYEVDEGNLLEDNPLQDDVEDPIDMLEEESTAKPIGRKSTRTKRKHPAKEETHPSKEKLRHTCPRCNEEFPTKRDFLQHKRTIHRDHMCDTCGLAFDTRFGLETHRKRHEPARPYKCEYCSLVCVTKPEMQLHIRRLHLKAFEVRCTECSLTFRTKQMLGQHMKTHTNQRTHTCKVCGFAFKSHTHLSRHTKELHQGVMYKCDHCPASYRRKDKLRMHVEKMHNIQTYFVCDICLQSYDAAEKLQEHKAHHDTPKELQCGVCLGAYTAQKDFDEHLCITYRDNYICCGRDFKYHYFYNKHMFLAHGQKTNVRVKPVDGMLLGQYRANRKQVERCPKCEQEFPTRQQKKVHMETCGMVEYYVLQVVKEESEESKATDSL